MAIRSRARSIRSARARLRHHPRGVGGQAWIGSALWLSVRLLTLVALANNWGGATKALAGEVRRLSEVVVVGYVSSITEQVQSAPIP